MFRFRVSATNTPPPSPQRVANELTAYIEERRLKEALRKILNGTASRTEVLKLKEVFTKKWLRPIIQESEKSYAIENEIDEKRRRIAAQERNVRTIEGVQARLRENIKGLEKVSANQATNKLLSRYLSDLNTQEVSL